MKISLPLSMLAACGLALLGPVHDCEATGYQVTDSALPTSFRALVGGFLGISYRVELKDGALEYFRSGSGKDGGKSERVVPSVKEWEAFRTSLDSIGVWKWKPSYPNLAVDDGTQWTLVIAYDGRSLKTEGSNSFPTDSGLPNNRPEYTASFSSYLMAVSHLLGGKPFGLAK